MSKSANVRSVQTLKDFKLVMCNFAEEGRNSLSGVDMELRRMRDWLERDQLGYWQAQVKMRNEDLMQARADLHRRKISQQGSDAVSDAEQKENLREAQRRVRVAEEKVSIVRKLIPLLHHAIDEYHSHSQPLGDHLAGGFEKSVMGLEKMIGALDAYLALRRPRRRSSSRRPHRGQRRRRAERPPRPSRRPRRPKHHQPLLIKPLATAAPARAPGSAEAAEPPAAGRVS